MVFLKRKWRSRRASKKAANKAEQSMSHLRVTRWLFHWISVILMGTLKLLQGKSALSSNSVRVTTQTDKNTQVDHLVKMSSKEAFLETTSHQFLEYMSLQ